jgi:hypothetical protein
VAEAIFQRDQRVVERLALVATLRALRQAAKQRAEPLGEGNAPIARLERLGRQRGKVRLGTSFSVNVGN